MVDTSIHFKNDRNFRKESILIILFKPVFRFKSDFINSCFELLIFRKECSNTTIGPSILLIQLHLFILSTTSTELYMPSPFTNNICVETYDEIGIAKKNTALAISSSFTP